jgi:antitoxin (DNA-binding transcriptional repressor) of toxin-antitoxin stability system
MPIYLDLHQQDLSLVTLQQSLAAGEEVVITDITQPIARVLPVTNQLLRLWVRRSNQTLGEPQSEVVLSDDSLETAARALANDYTNDKELTTFRSLDGDEFYA